MFRRGRSKRTRRRWWQVLSRILVIAVLSLGGAYVTLPWWLPAPLVRAWLAKDLSRLMGLDVTIGKMSLSWGNGIIISDLRIASPPEFGSDPMVEIERIRADFSPIDFLLREQLSWMDLDGVRISARTDQHGDINLAPLSKLAEGPEARRISVRRAQVTLRVHQQDRELLLDVRNLQYVAGRVRRLGRVTMSAVLEPEGSPTPISLSVAAGTGEETAADATFNFTNLDLAQLDLPRLLGLPLRKFAGQCNGSLDLRVNRQGVADHFSFDLAISKLDVQPENGPQLPVIDKAHLRVAAAYDLINRQIEIQSASVLLPGMDLSARARMFTEIREGRWRAIRRLDMAGKIEPAQLAGLLTGNSVLPGEFSVEGPVAVELAARHEGASVDVDLSLRATDVEIRRHDEVIKPAGRKFQVELAGILDDRTWDFTFQERQHRKTRFLLGDNSFELRGTLRDIRGLKRRWVRPDRTNSLQAALDGLSHLDCKGRWEISELDSLRDAFRSLMGGLGNVQLSGKVGGEWSITPADQGQIRAEANVQIPPESTLSVSEQFVKPAGKAIGLRVGGVLQSDRRTVRDPVLELAVGAGTFQLDRARVLLTGGGESTEGFDLSGGFEVGQVQDLLECFPQLRSAGVVAAGAGQGDCRIRVGPKLRQVSLKADLTRTRLSWGRWFTKPLGQQGEVQVVLGRDETGPVDRKARIQCVWRCPTPKADITLSAFFPSLTPGTMPQTAQLVAVADFKDASWLPHSCPFLKEYLAGAELGGNLVVKASGKLQGSTLQADVSCEADKVKYVSDGKVRRAKAAGVPLNLRVRGQFTKQEDDGILIDIQKAAIRFAQTQLELSGGATFQGAIAPDERLWPQPGLQNFRIAVDGNCTFDEPLGALSPELTEVMRKYQLDGAITLSAELTGNREEVSLHSRVDATRLSAGPFRLGLGSGKDEHSIRGVSVSKPGGLPTRVEIDAKVPVDLSRLRINNLRLDLGKLEVLADGSAALKLNASGVPVGAEMKKAHLAVRTDHAETLQRVLPMLKEYELTGDVFLETELHQAEGVRAPYVTFHCKELRGKYREKDLILRGDVVARNVRLNEGVPSQIRRLKTDALEFRIGENHGWLVVDVADLLVRPSGNIHVIAEYLDSKDLQDWFVPEDLEARREGKLTKEATTALQQDARDLIEKALPYVQPAGLDLRASVRHLRTFDASVEQFYDVRQVELNASAHQGLVRVGYAGGLNGGLIQAEYLVDLGDPDPVVQSESTMQDVIALENMQPQVAKYFPGNTVEENFSRNEKVNLPLRDLLVNAMDVRYPLRPVGTAKTVTTDGFVEGRAAPKFITAIFPGLNLAKYRYKQMTGFATYRGDGVAENDMVFSGQLYDLYIEGTTDAENIGRYTIGVILVGTPQTAEWNHAWRVGRIPILKVKARIEGGKMHDERVSYLRPDQTLAEILIKNNPINRILVNVRKP